jgi:hypothetical protein
MGDFHDVKLNRMSLAILMNSGVYGGMMPFDSE